MWRQVVWQRIIDVSEERTTSIFTVDESSVKEGGEHTHQTQLAILQTPWRHVAEESSLRNHHLKILRSQKWLQFYQKQKCKSLSFPSAFTLVSCSAFSNLKMEAVCSSEMSVDFQRITWRYISKESTLHNHRCDNLKSYIIKSSSLHKALRRMQIWLKYMALNIWNIPKILRS
jgi:hypothetical protein